MNDAYFEVADDWRRKMDLHNPSFDDIDEIIKIGIENYPNGRTHSFVVNDGMAYGAVVEAFNLLWDQGKIPVDDRTE